MILAAARERACKWQSCEGAEQRRALLSFPASLSTSSFALRVTSHDIPQIDSLFADNNFCVHMHLKKTKS